MAVMMVQRVVSSFHKRGRRGRRRRLKMKRGVQLVQSMYLFQVEKKGEENVLNS